MTNPFSRLGYAALKLESVVGTAVKPDTYFELLAEDVLGEYGRQAVTGITGKRDAKLRSVNDKISVSGMITVLVEPNTIGYLFRALLGTPSTMTLQAGKVYRHVFTPSTTLQTYTIDLKKAGENYVRRIIGAYIEQAEFSQTDNKIQVVLTVRALGIFDHARLTTNEASNSTVYGVDQTKGITTGDILLVRSSGDQDTDLMTHSVASVDNETQVTVDAKAVAATESDLVLIKASTPLYTLSDNLTWIGGSKYGVRAEDDIYNAIDNIETSDAEDYSLIIMNTLEERHTARGSNLADRFPARIFAKDFLVEGSFTHYYSSPEFIDDMRSKGKVATRVRHYGAQIDTNSAVAASLTIGSEPGAVVVTADTAGEDGNDLNVTIVTNSTDALVAQKMGNNILVKLANATAGNNRADDVASAISALSGVSATGVSTTVSVGVRAKTNLAGGRNANEKASLRIDLPNTLYRPFSDNMSEEDLITEEIEFDAYFDDTESLTMRAVLINGKANYN